MSKYWCYELRIFTEGELQNKIKQLYEADRNSVCEYISVYCQTRYFYEDYCQKAEKSAIRNDEKQNEYFAKAAEWKYFFNKIIALITSVRHEAVRTASKRFYDLLQKIDIEISWKSRFFEMTEDIIYQIKKI